MNYQDFPVLDLSDLKYIYKSFIQEINLVYTLDEQNQIYLSKDNYIQISRKMQLRVIQQQLFLELNNDKITVFSIQNQIKYVFQQKMKIVKDNDPEFLGIYDSFYQLNKLLIIEFQHNYLESIHYQLRNIINGKLLRNFISYDDQSQGIADNKFYYVCRVLEKNYMTLIYRLNLILGQDQQMRFPIPIELDTPFITKNILIDVENYILRYYIYE